MIEIEDNDIKQVFDVITSLFSIQEAEEIYSQAVLAFPVTLNKITTRDENLVLRKAYMLGALTTYKMIYSKKNEEFVAQPIDQKELEKMTEERYKKEVIKD